MRHFFQRRVLVSLAVLVVAEASVQAQITDNFTGDGVLNAPYRGTIDSLREATKYFGYGEVRNHVLPGVTGEVLGGNAVRIWHEVEYLGDEYESWDRSVLRLYRELDCSGQELDLTNALDLDSAIVISPPYDFEMFSFRAIGTKTLAPLRFRVVFRFRIAGEPQEENHYEHFTVAPMTASFLGISGEDEMFQFGVPMLDVSVGNTRLVVPTGRTAFTIGAAFNDRTRLYTNTLTLPNQDLLILDMFASDVVFPGAAESVHLPHKEQFDLIYPSNYPKELYNRFGTPWPGHLVGYFANNWVHGPRGEVFDTIYENADIEIFEDIMPFDHYNGHPSAVWYVYSGYLQYMRDLANPYNYIDLFRNSQTDFVETIETSDGRVWNILAEPGTGYILGVEPDFGPGARYFKYNEFGRITQVRFGAYDGGDPFDPDIGEDIMYKFVYDDDGDLREEWRFVDDELRLVVKHEIVDEGHRRRIEYAGPLASDIRYFDFEYAADASPPAKHLLTTVTAYSGPSGTGTEFVTEYTRDFGSASDPPEQNATTVLNREVLPDQTELVHEYDCGCPDKFGFLTKTTHEGPGGALIKHDIDYEFYYSSGDDDYLFTWPRVITRRDGRGYATTYDYENAATDQNGDGVDGQILNQLLSVTGPIINNLPQNTRTPKTLFAYDADERALSRRKMRYAAGLFRLIDYFYDLQLRPTGTVVDPYDSDDNPGGTDIITSIIYNDADSTQDRTIVDPADYYTTTTFDQDGRVLTHRRYLNSGGVGPNFYGIENLYYNNGRLYRALVDHKDQNGTPITTATVIEYEYDRLGRVILRTDGYGVIGRQTNTVYNWLAEIISQYDTSGRGFERTFDGRGLVVTETPLDDEQAPITSLTVTYEHDAVGRVTAINNPTGSKVELVRDDFGRVIERKEVPNPNESGSTISTHYEYDGASNVTRQYVKENGTIYGDVTQAFDKGGFLYRIRRRTAAGSDSADDPLVERWFDGMGNVTRVIQSGDTTVPDRTTTIAYDGASRVSEEKTYAGDPATGPLLAKTTYTRDDRGNVVEQRVLLEDGAPPNEAVTNAEYDAVNRAIHVTNPENMTGGRSDQLYEYDSRNNLIEETWRNFNDEDKLVRKYEYDRLGRMTRAARMADIEQAYQDPDPATDRVVDYVYDADGRLTAQETYNSNSSSPLTTTITYDDAGRRDRITDPSGAHVDDNYTTTGRLFDTKVADGLGIRTFSYGYDGHDRIVSRMAEGAPNLTTTVTLDALDRPIAITDPRGVVGQVAYDLVGRTVQSVEDAGGALQRETLYAYNRLDQLIQRTAKNETAIGPQDQITSYRNDAMDRPLRITYPDSTNPDPDTGDDCVRLTWDQGGRLTTRIDQRQLTTTYIYNDKNELHYRQTMIDGVTYQDKYGYDSLRNLTSAKRGTPNDDDAVSDVFLTLNGRGEVISERQAIGTGADRTMTYERDQAGNRKSLASPNGPTLTYTYTNLNQVDTIDRNGADFIDYTYDKHLFNNRKTLAPDSQNFAFYLFRHAYDDHRRVNVVGNDYVPNEISIATVLAEYGFTHDEVGNPLTQSCSGIPLFQGDARTFTVDDLNRLIATDYNEFPNDLEESTLDRVGNRESHTTRTGTTTAYTLANGANEYAAVGGQPVLYDAGGNLIQDEAGRQYLYDERSLLTQVKNASGGVLANYTYDALGRRIIVEDVVAGTTKRYYYDGASVIQERNGSDVLTQYHVNGGQYIDERVATMDGSGDWLIHLMGNNFSVVGDGDPDGLITRTPYGTLGDFVGTPPESGTFTLHGRPIDVLSDGLVLMSVRARVYDPKNARWLQRDPSGYVDGNNLYESFGSNPYSSTDPEGSEIWVEADRKVVTTQGVRERKRDRSN